MKDFNTSMFRNINVEFFMSDVYDEGKSRSQDKAEHGEDEGENRRGVGENRKEEGGNTVFLPNSLTHTCTLIKHIN